MSPKDLLISVTFKAYRREEGRRGSRKGGEGWREDRGRESMKHNLGRYAHVQMKEQ